MNATKYLSAAGIVTAGAAFLIACGGVDNPSPDPTPTPTPTEHQGTSAPEKGPTLACGVGYTLCDCGNGSTACCKTALNCDAFCTQGGSTGCIPN